MKFQPIMLGLVLSFAACDAKQELGKAAPPGQETKTPPPTAKQDAPAAPEKTPEQIEAERKAAREAEIRKLVETIENEKLENSKRWEALMALKDMKPFPSETIDAAMDLVRTATGMPPTEGGADLGPAALHVILAADPKEAARAAEVVLQAVEDQKNKGIFKADLLSAVSRIVPAEKGVPVLVAALQDQMYCAIAMQGLVLYGKPSVAPLIQAVKTLPPGNPPHGNAMFTLARIGKDAVEAVPLLIELLKKAEMTEVSSVARALGEFGPLAKDALPALREVADGGMFGAGEAADAIKRIEGK